MKKLVFSVLACVAFAGSAFAANEVVREEDSFKGDDKKVESNDFSLDKLFDNCAGSFVYKDKTGKQMTKTLTGGTKESYSDCLDWMEDKMADLQAAGYTLVKYSNTYNWTNK